MTNGSSTFVQPFVDLTTQNGRVKRIEVSEIEGE